MKALFNERGIKTLMAALVAALMAAVVLSAGTVSKADASTTPQMTTCQDNNGTCAIYPNGGWKKVVSSKASGGSYHISTSTTRSAVYIPTSGPEIDLVTATGPKLGTARVFVFNIVTGEKVKVVKFNLRAERSHYKVVKRITGLREDTLYAALVVSADGKPVVVDAFKSFSPELPPPPEGVTPPGS